MTSALHDFNIHPSTRISYVSLNVSEISRSLDFYEKVLGFNKVDRPSNERVLLSVDGHPSYLVELLQAKNAASYKASMPETRRAGLYHYAILLPERKYLADMLQNLSERRGEIRFDGLADHLVSESIYIRDPDNIGVEIYYMQALSRSDAIRNENIRHNDFSHSNRTNFGRSNNINHCEAGGVTRLWSNPTTTTP